VCVCMCACVRAHMRLYMRAFKYLCMHSHPPSHFVLRQPSCCWGSPLACFRPAAAKPGDPLPPASSRQQHKVIRSYHAAPLLMVPTRLWALRSKNERAYPHARTHSGPWALSNTLLLAPQHRPTMQSVVQTRLAGAASHTARPSQASARGHAPRASARAPLPHHHHFRVRRDIGVVGWAGRARPAPRRAPHRRGRWEHSSSHQHHHKHHSEAHMRTNQHQAKATGHDGTQPARAPCKPPHPTPCGQHTRTSATRAHTCAATLHGAAIRL